MKFIDLTNQKFGSLTVIKYIEKFIKQKEEAGEING